MTGMFDILARAGVRAGLLRETTDEPGQDSAADAAADAGSSPDDSAAPSDAAPGMSLDQIYAAGGVPASPYPAERLLRLLAGLKVMDPATRHQAIAAMDAADDSWTIADPITDATLKVSALEGHSKTLRASIAQYEMATRDSIAQARQRQDSSAAEIRRQISDLEALLAREIARAEQECGALEADLAAKKVEAAHELDALSSTKDELIGLISQFNVTGN